MPINIPSHLFSLVAALKEKSICLPSAATADIREFLNTLPADLKVEINGDFDSLQDQTITPRPVLDIGEYENSAENLVPAKLSHYYENIEVALDTEKLRIKIPGTKKHIQRSLLAEKESLLTLKQAAVEFKYPHTNSAPQLFIARNKLVKVIGELLSKDWEVKVSGNPYKRQSKFSANITSSGIDWFDIEIAADFDGEIIELPELLLAVKEKRPHIRLKNGGLGLIPEDVLRKLKLIRQLTEKPGKTDDSKSFRFRANQTLIIEALTADLPEVDVDDAFNTVRNRLRNFSQINPCNPEKAFKGKLRTYQKEGLGWLKFLQDLNLGGILADDMGLGKTIQVLALLQSLKVKASKKSDLTPSLVVVPRSLLINWQREAQTFAPDLNVYLHDGAQRSQNLESFKKEIAKQDLIITTYQLMQRDILFLKEITFNYLILDEAQAIKNSDTATFKAVCLLNSQHKLALTGTPVENDISDLLSFFNFLQPGYLSKLILLKAEDQEDRENFLQILSTATRPFILRRTKKAVLKDLPDKVEQTIWCELQDEERTKYDELKVYYQKKIKLEKSPMIVLEALMRLRQAAIHTGLLDEKRTRVESAKTEVLLEKLEELVAEGHKALVFSQFTGFLDILEPLLEKRKIKYLRLDGSTPAAKRQEFVDQFQNDPEQSVFLISLKAGGVGLNLTAANYAFLMDPWWNPAAEMQAVDRTHRIGQSKTVHAIKIVSANTVEERVLELQAQKKDLADKLIQSDSGLLNSISQKEMLELLS